MNPKGRFSNQVDLSVCRGNIVFKPTQRRRFANSKRAKHYIVAKMAPVSRHHRPPRPLFPGKNDNEGEKEARRRDGRITFQGQSALASVGGDDGYDDAQ